MAEDTSRISFTAHYTAHTWYRHGESDPALATRGGWALFQLARPLMAAVAPATGGITLATLLLQRHRILDHLLERAIAEHGIGQVVELAAGLSPRGLKFTRRHGDRLRYLETDLPGMVDAKGRRLERAGATHRIVPLNILATDGPESLEAVFDRELDPGVPTAVITEGLINYFPRDVVAGLWARIAAALNARAGGVYLSDLHNEVTGERARALFHAFQALLGMLTRGRTHMHFAGVEATRAALAEAGFDAPRVHRPEAFYDSLDIPRTRALSLVRVIEAWTGPAAR